MASKKRSGKAAGKKTRRDPNELDEMSDDMTQRGEAAGLGEDGGEAAERGTGDQDLDEVVEVAEIEGVLIPEGESDEALAEGTGEERAEEAGEMPTSSGSGRGKAGNGRERRPRRASKPRSSSKSTSKAGGKKKR